MVEVQTELRKKGVKSLKKFRYTANAVCGQRAILAILATLAMLAILANTKRTQLVALRYIGSAWRADVARSSRANSSRQQARIKKASPQDKTR